MIDTYDTSLCIVWSVVDDECDFFRTYRTDGNFIINMFKLLNRIPKTAVRGGFINYRMASPLNVRFISTEIKDAIQKAVDSSKIVLFMKGTPEFPQCGFSRASIQILGQQGVDPEKFAAYNVLEDQELREGIKEFSNWPTIPQLYVDGEFIGGCDIIMSMAKSGELAELLENSDCLVPEEPELESNVQPQERN